MDKDQRQFLRSTLIVLAPTIITILILIPAYMLRAGSYGTLLIGASLGQWVYGVWWSQVYPALTTYLNRDKQSQDSDIPVAQRTEHVSPKDGVTG